MPVRLRLSFPARRYEPKRCHARLLSTESRHRREIHPSAMRPMTKSTERRVPRITGLPARTAESSTMRAGSAMVSPRVRLAAAVLSHLLEPPIVALPQPERSFACGHDVTKNEWRPFTSAPSASSAAVPPGRRGSTAVLAGCIYSLVRRLAPPRIVIVVADAADGPFRT